MMSMHVEHASEANFRFIAVTGFFSLEVQGLWSACRAACQVAHTRYITQVMTSELFLSMMRARKAKTQEIAIDITTID
jgi:hypothetical protein